MSIHMFLKCDFFTIIIHNSGKKTMQMIPKQLLLNLIGEVAPLQDDRQIYTTVLLQ